MKNGRMMVAYVITERANKKYWNRIGAAFENSDGSWNIKLDAFPVSGQLHIREPNDDDRAAPDSAPDHDPPPPPRRERKGSAR